MTREAPGDPSSSNISSSVCRGGEQQYRQQPLAATTVGVLGSGGGTPLLRSTFRMAHRRSLVALLAAHLLLAVLSAARSGAAGSPAADTWAVIVSSSRYWLNYRHASNALGVYQAVRR